MYGLPQSTIVNKTIHKKTFVDQLGANAQMKDHFTRDIEHVQWLAKLAPSTLNVNDGREVHEIAVLTVRVKIEDCPNNIFAFIDTLMPRHTLFILESNNKACLHINYKEWCQAGGERKFKITKTYRSPWTTAAELAVKIDSQSMDGIYESLVRQVAAEHITSDHHNLRRAIELTTERDDLLKEIGLLEKKIIAERQPTKKFSLHKKLNELKDKI